MDSRTERLDLKIEGSEITAIGELDSYTAPLLAGALEGSATSVTLDLAGVSFIDSAVLKMLVEWHERLREQGLSLQLREPSKIVARLLQISGLSEHFVIV